MEKIQIIRINENRFKAFVMFTKSPKLISLFTEVEFYATSDNSVLGTITIDAVDKKYNSVVLCRDEHGKFKGVELKCDINSLNEARDWLTENMKLIVIKEETIQTQGDKRYGINLFDIVLDPAKLHPYFKLLNETVSFLPAKTMLTEISKFYRDIDGNFVEQFQSLNGFDARIWELYMFCFLTEQEFTFSRHTERPDFIVEKYETQIAIEAVIVSRKQETPVVSGPVSETLMGLKLDKSKKEMPLKYSNALVSKLKKKYWELPQIKNMPLVFAIADFHDDLSMTWSFNSLIEYLYGYTYDFHYDKDQQLKITPRKLSNYIKANGSEVEPGFFLQPEAENISGVLFSSVGTLSKFTRIGIQSGFSSGGLRILRFGNCKDHDPNASRPKAYSYEVTENSTETWTEGMNLYHNPFAKHPIDRRLFKSVAHHYLDKNNFIQSFTAEFHPFNSMQMNIVPVKNQS